MAATAGHGETGGKATAGGMPAKVVLGPAMFKKPIFGRRFVRLVVLMDVEVTRVLALGRGRRDRRGRPAAPLMRLVTFAAVAHEPGLCAIGRYPRTPVVRAQNPDNPPLASKFFSRNIPEA